MHVFVHINSYAGTTPVRFPLRTQGPHRTLRVHGHSLIHRSFRQSLFPFVPVLVPGVRGHTPSAPEFV